MSKMWRMKQVLSAPDVRVYLGRWKGETQVHVRKFVDKENYTGPTKQGVMVPLENTLDLVTALLDVYGEETGKRFAISDLMTDD